MKKIWGKRVLLPDGWSYNTLVEIDEKGKIKEIKNSSTWNREEFVKLFHEMIPDFGHKETGKFLDQRM